MLRNNFVAGGLLGLLLLVSAAMANVSISKNVNVNLQCSQGKGNNFNFVVTVTNINAASVLTGITVTLQQGVFVGTIPYLGPGQSQALTGTAAATSNGILGPAILSATADGIYAIAVQSNLATCAKPTPPTTKKPAAYPHISGSKTCTATVDSKGKIQVCWRASITNDGNVPFSSITVTENTGSMLAPQAAQALPVGATTVVTGCYTPSDPNARYFSDSVTVVAVSIAGVSNFGPFVATCPAPVSVTTPSPKKIVKIDVIKRCYAVKEKGVVTVFWEAQIINSGQVGFTSITVTESQGLLAPQGAQALPVGASIRVSGSYNPSNPWASSFSDTVTVIAIAQGETSPRTFSGSATCPAPVSATTTTSPPSKASVYVTKYCTPRRVGSDVLVDYTIDIRNNGGVNFATLTVTDAETGTGAAPATFIISSGLAIGASTRITGTYRPSNQWAKSFSDTVSVFGTPVGSSSTIAFNPVTATCSFP